MIQVLKPFTVSEFEHGGAVCLEGTSTSFGSLKRNRNHPSHIFSEAQMFFENAW